MSSVQINSGSIPRADKFNNWTNSTENYKNYLEGGNGGEFQMFNFNPKTYSSDLAAFAKEYLDKFDEDKNGKLDFNEFIKMAEVPELSGKMTAEKHEMLKKAFAGLNLDDDDNTITSEEFASQLYITDLDLDKYLQTRSIVSSLDGSFSFENYHGLSSILPGDNGFDFIKREKTDFFNAFYNK